MIREHLTEGKRVTAGKGSRPQGDSWKLAVGHTGRCPWTGMQTSDIRNHQDCYTLDFNPKRANDTGPEYVDGKERRA